MVERDSGGIKNSTRRTVLRTIGTASLVGLAGCSSGNEETTGAGGETTSTSGNEETTGAGGETTSTSGNEETTGAGGETTSASKEWPDLTGTKLHFIYGQPSEEAQQYFNGIASDFEEATGAEMNMEFTGVDNLNSRVTQLLQAGSPPEVANTNSQYAPTYATQDVLRPLTGVVDSLIDKYGNMTTGSRLIYNEEDRYVPLWANPQMFFYRTDLSDTVPDTWENLLTYAEEVEQSNEVEHGNYQPAGTGVDDFWSTVSFAYTNNVEIVTRKDGQIVTTIDQGDNKDRWIEVLKFFKNRYKFSPNTSDSSWSAALNSIPQEVVGESWYGGARIKNEVNRQDVEFADAVDLVWPKGQSRTFSGGTDGFVSFQGSNGEAADAFLKFMTQPDRLAPIYWIFSKVHNAPVYPEIRETDMFQDELQNLLDSTTWTREQVKYYQVSAVEEMRFVSHDTDPPHPYVGTIISSDHLQNMVAEVLINDKSPSDAIDAAAKGLQNVLDDAQN